MGYPERRTAMPSNVYVKRGDRTYVYSSESYWDAKKKAPRSRMTYIGILQEDGTIAKKRDLKNKQTEQIIAEATADREKAEQIVRENEALKLRNEEMKKELAAVVERMEKQLSQVTADLSRLKELMK